MSKIGVNIAQKRHKLQMTQETLADKANISTNYVSRLERGEINHIRAETLLKIAKGLNTTMESLIENKNEKEKQHIYGYYQTKLIKLLSNIDSDKAEELSKNILNLLTSNISNNNNNKK